MKKILILIHILVTMTLLTFASSCTKEELSDSQDDNISYWGFPRRAYQEELLYLALDEQQREATLYKLQENYSSTTVVGAAKYSYEADRILFTPSLRDYEYGTFNENKTSITLYNKDNSALTFLKSVVRPF